MEKIRIGCSGWTYRHWRGLFYPASVPQRRWFSFYSEQFDTVEINNSFYRLPSPETVGKWRDQAPEGFCYAVKANRFITQAKKLMDCSEPLERMMNIFRLFGPSLGPILYQLPPRLGFDPARLNAFLERLPRDVTSVFEFRDPGWYVPETFDLLERHGAALCVHDMAGSRSPRVAVGPIAYVRFHGGEGRYWGRYPEKDLLGWTDWITAQAGNGRPVWCFFNNDIEGHAIEDALTLRAMVAQAGRH